MSDETDADWDAGMIELGYEDANRSHKHRARKTAPMNPFPVVYLRCVDVGMVNERWVVCAKGDPGAIRFERS